MKPKCPKLIIKRKCNKQISPVALARMDKTLNINLDLFSSKVTMIKKVHTISDEFEFGDANENEVNQRLNATLRDFDDYLMDNAGIVATNKNDNVI